MKDQNKNKHTTLQEEQTNNIETNIETNINNNTTMNFQENNLNITQNKEVPIKEQIELKKNLFPINKSIRYYIYIIELLCLFNLDQGGISASTKEIKSYFKMTDRELGSFGGISFLGTTLGGIFSLFIINKINRRVLILIFLSIIIFSFLCSTFISSKILLIINRILTGFSQSFMSIYLPVWVDQFGIYSKKSIMMSLISVPSAIGYLLGYISGVLTSWRITFRINALISFILFICFFFSKNLYFSKSIVPKKVNNQNNSINKNDNLSLFEDLAVNNDKYGNQSIFSHAKNCFKSKLFCFSIVSLISLLLILSGLQFWMNDFLENSIHVLDKKERLLSFIIIILITIIGAPVTGGFILQKLGGYDSYKSIYLPFCCCIFSLICSNLLLVSSNKFFVAGLICGYLFSGCIMISCLNGIIISSIQKEYAGSASCISNLLYNICGRLVGPSFYGFTRSFFSIESKIPMVILLDVKFITLFCLYKCFKYKK